MRMNVAAAVWVLGLACLAGFASSAQGAPPKIDIPTNARTADPLPSVYVSQLSGHVAYWLKEIQSGKDFAGASKQLIRDGYLRYPNAGNGYRYAYARELANQAKGMITAMEGKRALQLALAISRINEAAMAPLFDAMASHKMPAVRYLAWQGYLNPGLRQAVLAGPKQQSKAFMDLLAKRAREETAPAVIGPMLDVLRIPSASGPLLPADAKVAQHRAWEITQSLWKPLCQKVIDGDLEAATAARQGVLTIAYYQQITKEDAKCLQMLLDVMYCACYAYDATGGEGTGADIEAQLIRDAELEIQRIASMPKLDYLQRVLVDKDLVADARCASVLIALLDDWIDKKLKPIGLKTPEFKRPTKRATSAPSRSVESSEETPSDE